MEHSDEVVGRPFMPACRIRHRTPKTTFYQGESVDRGLAVAPGLRAVRLTDEELFNHLRALIVLTVMVHRRPTYNTSFGAAAGVLSVANRTRVAATAAC